MLILVGVLAFLAAFFFIKFFSYPPGWDFRNNLWAPAYLLVHRQSPYDIHRMFDSSNAVWMPTAIGAFFPLGYLSLQHASNLWWLLNLTAMLSIIWLSAGQPRRRPLPLAAVMLLAFVFPPVIAHFVLGQISILTCLVFLVISTRTRKLPPFALAFLLALSLAKPQLAVFVLPGYLYSSFKDRRFKQGLRLLLYVVLAAALLTLPLFAADPRWYLDLARNLVGYQQWAHPSLLFWLSLKLGRSGLFIWAALFLAAFALNFRFWRRLPPSEAVLRSLALTPLLTPYVWSWDFVLLLPLLVHMAFRPGPNRARWILGFGFVSCSAVIMASKLSAELSDAYFWWVPWYLIGFALLSARLHPGDPPPEPLPAA